MYKLATPADANKFMPRVMHAIKRELPMTITYRKLDGEVVTRTIEPYAVALTLTGDPILRSMDRGDSTPKTWKMERIMYYTVHRSYRLVPKYVPTPTPLTV